MLTPMLALMLYYACVHRYLKNDSLTVFRAGKYNPNESLSPNIGRKIHRHTIQDITSEMLAIMIRTHVLIDSSESNQ